LVPNISSLIAFPAALRRSTLVGLFSLIREDCISRPHLRICTVFVLTARSVRISESFFSFPLGIAGDSSTSQNRDSRPPPPQKRICGRPPHSVFFLKGEPVSAALECSCSFGVFVRSTHAKSGRHWSSTCEPSPRRPPFSTINLDRIDD